MCNPVSDSPLAGKSRSFFSSSEKSESDLLSPGAFIPPPPKKKIMTQTPPPSPPRFVRCCRHRHSISEHCKTKQESPADARLRATAPSFQYGGCSKMAVTRHLGYYRTGNRTIWSADPENPCLEPDMEWIECTVCEIFAFKLYCDLETGFRGHSRSLKVAPWDRPIPKTSY